MKSISDKKCSLRRMLFRISRSHINRSYYRWNQVNIWNSFIQISRVSSWWI